MTTTSPIYRFGPFELDPRCRRLTRDRQHVWLPDRQLDLLLALTASAGQLLSKDTLTDAAWHGLAITDNSIVQAIRGLRNALGTQPNGESYIATHMRKGYEFVAPVERGQAQPSPPVSLDGMLEPYKAFVDGRAALEAFDCDGVRRARDAFASALRANPAFAAAHIGLANACLLAFESTRADTFPDYESLVDADEHARESCRLDPSAAHAWSTLAVVTHRRGDTLEAIAAARKAVTLAPDDWRHHIRLASVTWGEERLQAAQCARSLCPELALSYWFAATVLVARQMFDRALKMLRAGCAVQDAQNAASGRFRAAGLHLLHGLVLAATGAEDRAQDEFARELADESREHIYSRESSANSWYAIGALQLRAGQRDAARAAFSEALARVPGHPMARVGLQPESLSSGSDSFGRQHRMEAAIARAAVLALSNKHHDAARVCAEALAQAEAGSSGWMLPVDPVLHPTRHTSAWTHALSALRARAM